MLRSIELTRTVKYQYETSDHFYRLMLCLNIRKSKVKKLMLISAEIQRKFNDYQINIIKVNVFLLYNSTKDIIQMKYEFGLKRERIDG